MEDADRLFECLKRGLSTPEPMMKARKKSCELIRQTSSRCQEPSGYAEFASPGSPTKCQQTMLNKQLSIEKVNTPVTAHKQISPGIFYGSAHGAPAKRQHQVLRLLRDICEDLTEQSDLRKEIWATFPRQDQAMRFAESHGQVPIFSFQDHFSGQRRFLVSTYEEFWRRYKNMASKFRHHYEVIKEGMPCHLYFDLEFNTLLNAERNGDEMVDLLMSVIFDAISEKYSIQGKLEWILELDSSTTEKFSRHLIIHIPNVAFKDNLHVGSFVTELCSRISSTRDGDSRLNLLYVLKDENIESPQQLFIDTAVYSRNRCFRLVLSSKAGKKSVLLPTGRFKCKNLNERDIFLESLICRMDLDCRTMLCDDSQVNISDIPRATMPRTCTSHITGQYFAAASPFAKLDAFIESVACVGNVPGRIRSWYWFSEHGLMIYNIIGNRFCERIGREHKSNHVMYVVDFRKAGYYQKCYDPDCRGFRSPLRPIPWGFIPDDSGIYDSIPLEKNEGTVDIDFNLQLNEGNGNPLLHDNIKICESSKTDSRWWKEVVRTAIDIESTRKTLEFGKVVKIVMKVMTGGEMLERVHPRLKSELLVGPKFSRADTGYCFCHG
ncbi:hypothetical protein AMTRI_Chr09g35980 [Amborella trichopoda]